MAHIIVLGAGMVGSAMAKDLAKNHTVTAVDASAEVLQLLEQSGINTRQADLSDAHTIQQVVQDADLVIGAVPGFMGFNMAKAVIEAEKTLVDISFFPENPFILDELAKELGVTAVVDCGVAPGLSHMAFGVHHAHMQVQEYTCYVGGLPKTRTWPYEYKAPFSPIDVLEEYTRPARLIEHNKVVTREALSEAELLDFAPIGTLEAFNSDGLRTLLRFGKEVPFMKEKTLRFPGHVNLMKAFRETGFFSQDEIEVKGKKVKPIDLTTQLLFPKWKLEAGEQEFTLMRMEVSGQENGKAVTHVYDLYDEYHTATATSSMARTTGYTCTAVAQLILDGKFGEAGIIAPENLAMAPGCFQQVVNYLADRDIMLSHTTKER